jgi:hypothetical protein
MFLPISAAVSAVIATRRLTEACPSQAPGPEHPGKEPNHKTPNNSHGDGDFQYLHLILLERFCPKVTFGFIEGIL